MREGGREHGGYQRGHGLGCRAEVRPRLAQQRDPTNDESNHTRYGDVNPASAEQAGYGCRCETKRRDSRQLLSRRDGRIERVHRLPRLGE